MKITELYSHIEEKLAESERLVIAIDGGAASGKSTLANDLAKRFQGAVIHMDDCFLRPEQRTEERLAEAGGNLDRERFLVEVIPHLRKEEGFSYQRFDCSEMALGEFVFVPKTRLLIVEGSYSHHPAFGEAYDLKIFLSVSEMTRKSRILARNGEEKYQMFVNRWIPLENRYFDAFSIPEKADILING